MNRYDQIYFIVNQKLHYEYFLQAISCLLNESKSYRLVLSSPLWNGTTTPRLAYWMESLWRQDKLPLTSISNITKTLHALYNPVITFLCVYSQLTKKCPSLIYVFLYCAQLLNIQSS